MPQGVANKEGGQPSMHGGDGGVKMEAEIRSDVARSPGTLWKTSSYQQLDGKEWVLPQVFQRSVTLLIS